ncbi:MAG: GNAT family N-acetyltransferase [Terriglobales bacterium]
MPLHLRLAIAADEAELKMVIEASVRGLQAGDYTARQIELALRGVYGVDTQLIRDGTYFAVESGAKLVGCGGWSKRRTLYGGDQGGAREDALLNPAREAAKIRAFFVLPDYARRGIGSLILEACETAAQAAGFQRLEMGATLSGVPFYRARGYEALEDVAVPLGEGEVLPIVRMSKHLPLIK